METGSTSEWSANGGGGLFNSGTYEAVATSELAHTGANSLRARIWTPGESGVRAFRWSEARSNRSLYYSVWMYIPTNYTLTADPNTGQFWNLFQFKSRTPDSSRIDPLWSLNAAPDGAGALYLRAGWGWGGATLSGPRATDGVGGKWFEPATRRSLPVGRWFHLQAMLHQSKDFDGRLTFWQDGVQLLDLTGVRTSYVNCNYNSWCADNEWSVNHYSDGLSPNPATIYIDDASIATGYIP